MPVMRNKLMFSNMAAREDDELGEYTTNRSGEEFIKRESFSFLTSNHSFIFSFFGYVIMSGSAEKVTGRFDTKSFSIPTNSGKMVQKFRSL